MFTQQSVYASSHPGFIFCLNSSRYTLAVILLSDFVYTAEGLQSHLSAALTFTTWGPNVIWVSSQTYCRLSHKEKLFVSWQSSPTCGVLNYGSGWRKDVVNQCLEFDQPVKSTQLCLGDRRHSYYTQYTGGIETTLRPVTNAFFAFAEPQWKRKPLVKDPFQYTGPVIRNKQKLKPWIKDPFQYTGPVIRNKLPYDIRTSPTKSSFKVQDFTNKIIIQKFSKPICLAHTTEFQNVLLSCLPHVEAWVYDVLYFLSHPQSSVAVWTERGAWAFIPYPILLPSLISQTVSVNVKHNERKKSPPPPPTPLPFCTISNHCYLLLYFQWVRAHIFVLCYNSNGQQSITELNSSHVLCCRRRCPTDTVKRFEPRRDVVI